jgi:DNA-binding response OmpR family regulator/two-component sensor histidine kinase
MEKILIVEDDIEVRENLVEVLELNNYSVLQAQNGLDALEVLKTTIPDLVISDVMMPKMDGHDLIKIMQKNLHTSTVPFIFLTAKSNSVDMREGMTLGADDYITKPYDTNDLLNAIKTRIRKKKLFEEKVKNISDNISITVPHEMRTPLVSILGVSELITEEHENMKKDEIIDLVRQMKTTGRRLHKTIEKFLIYYDINMLTSYKELFYKNAGNEETEIESVIDSLKLKFFRNNCMGRSIDYKIKNCKVSLASYHLEFVLEELLCNACKFSDDNTVVQFSGALKDENVYTIEIKDNGIGMTPEQINSISAFSQFDKEKLNQRGNGLGLATVMKILEHYGCDFKIKSVLNEYTKVTINIPLSKKKIRLTNKLDTTMIVN